MEPEKIRTGVPGWVVALVAVACLFWGGVGGVVIVVLNNTDFDDVFGFGAPDDTEQELEDGPILTVGPSGDQGEPRRRAGRVLRG